MTLPDARRTLPALDRLLNTPTGEDLITRYGRPLAVAALRAELDLARTNLAADHPTDTTPDGLLSAAQAHLAADTAPTLFPVINATGVIIHTNLGRAPLSTAAQRAVAAVAADFNTLEYDIAKGQRGSRSVHAERLLSRITGAEAATVVNNNASAIMLILTALAKGRKVAISRGQLVEIGGGFRIPDVLRQSGAKLVEIGTTNRTHLLDYEAAILEDGVKVVMRAHHSNYRIIGFTTEPDLPDITTLAHQHDVPVVDDIGSGALIDPAQFGLGHEPLIQDSITAGVDLVAFSGDKLLGGPQSGIIVGKKALIDRLKKHPLMRAIRPDKLCLAGLEATLLHYLKDEALTEIPVWRMISRPLTEIRAHAERIVAALQTHGLTASVIEGHSTVGGGSLPEETLPTWLVALSHPKPDRLLAALRRQRIIARIQDDTAVLDPRTLLDPADDRLLAGLVAALAKP